VDDAGNLVAMLAHHFLVMAFDLGAGFALDQFGRSDENPLFPSDFLSFEVAGVGSEKLDILLVLRLAPFGPGLALGVAGFDEIGFVLLASQDYGAFGWNFGRSCH